MLAILIVLMTAAKKVFSQNKHIQYINFVHFTCISIIILLISALNLIVYFSPPKTKVVYAQSELPEQEIRFIKQILYNNPSYREGWVNLAKLEYKTGNIYNARMAIQKVEELDPNYSDLENLKRLVNPRYNSSE